MTVTAKIGLNTQITTQISSFKTPDLASTQSPSVFCNYNTDSKQAQAQINYNGDLETGKLKLVEEKSLFGTKEFYLYSVNEGGETFGSIKKRYNLPDGVFKDHVEDLPGNRDLYKIYNEVEIPVEILEKAVGIK